MKKRAYFRNINQKNILKDVISPNSQNKSEIILRIIRVFVEKKLNDYQFEVDNQHYFAQFVPIPDSRKKTKYCVIIIENVTRLIDAEKQVIDAGFLIAHKLRGPLARAMGLLMLFELEDTGINEKGKTLIKLVSHELRHEDKLIHLAQKFVEEKEKEARHEDN